MYPPDENNDTNVNNNDTNVNNNHVETSFTIKNLWILPIILYTVITFYPTPFPCTTDFRVYSIFNSDLGLVQMVSTCILLALGWMFLFMKPKRFPIWYDEIVLPRRWSKRLSVLVNRHSKSVFLQLYFVGYLMHAGFTLTLCILSTKFPENTAWLALSFLYCFNANNMIHVATQNDASYQSRFTVFMLSYLSLYVQLVIELLARNPVF